jgi:beta-lactamase class A
MTTFDNLVARLHERCDAHPFHTGWYLRDLKTGATADRHGDVVVPAASTRKVAILMAALRAVHVGKLSLDDRVTVDERWLVSDSGVFQYFQPGFTITVQDVLLMMIIVSDNACTGIICEMIGLDAVNRFSRDVGMVATVHREAVPQYTIMSRVADGSAVMSDLPGTVNETTPRDAGVLLEAILRCQTDDAYAASLGVTPDLATRALEMMSRQRLRARLPFLLPGNTHVAHKTGTSGTTYNDIGIVYRDGAPRFVLAVYTAHVPAVLPDGRAAPGATSLLIGGLARDCWDALG